MNRPKSDLLRLTILDLAQNGLADRTVSSLALGNISILNLADNAISLLKPLSRLLGLVTLNLNNNKVADVDEVAHLDKLPMLQSVDFSYNPICADADYRSQVLGRFPNRIHEIMVNIKQDGNTSQTVEFPKLLHIFIRYRQVRVREFEGSWRHVYKQFAHLIFCYFQFPYGKTKFDPFYSAGRHHTFSRRAGNGESDLGPSPGQVVFRGRRVKIGDWSLFQLANRFHSLIFLHYFFLTISAASPLALQTYLSAPLPLSSTTQIYRSTYVYYMSIYRLNMSHIYFKHVSKHVSKHGTINIYQIRSEQ